jgi:hypothetical protein
VGVEGVRCDEPIFSRHGILVSKFMLESLNEAIERLNSSIVVLHAINVKPTERTGPTSRYRLGGVLG